MSKGYLLQLICPQNVGYVFGSSTRGQRSLYDTGLTGIPITNCNNNCSTGSTALFLSRNLVAGGMADCALALGFEKMQKGSLAVDDDDVNPLGAWIYTCICCMKPSSTCVCVSTCTCVHVMLHLKACTAENLAMSYVGGCIALECQIWLKILMPRENCTYM